MIDAIDYQLSRIPVPFGWYGREGLWFEVVIYNPALRQKIVARIAHYDFAEALKDARRFNEEFGDAWRIIRHGDISVKIAESYPSQIHVVENRSCDGIN